MKTLAEYILFLAEHKGILVNNRKLQATMFFSLRKAYLDYAVSINEITEIYDTPFCIWRVGAVVPDIYDEYKVFGNDPIIPTSKLWDTKYTGYIKYRKYIEEVLLIDTDKLLETERAENFWVENKDYIHGWRSSVVYPVSVVYKEYKENVLKKIIKRMGC